MALEKESEPEVFLPYEQSPWTQYSLILKTNRNPMDAVQSVRSAIRAIDPDVPITKISTMENMISGSIMDRRLKATTFNIFAALGAALAVVGLYGLLSYSVKRRTPEIGVRMAIGAQSSDVLRMIMKQGIVLISIGVAIGLAFSFYVNRLLMGLLYGVSTTDLITIFSICAFVTVTGLIACYIPARRASRVHPIIALRNQ
jgi:putative ABC transport system permease protein